MPKSKTSARKPAANSRKESRTPAKPEPKVPLVAVPTKRNSKPGQVLPVRPKVIVAPKKYKKKAAVKSTSKQPRPAKKQPVEAIKQTAEPKLEPSVILLPQIPHNVIAGRATEIWAEKLRVANDSVRNWLEAEAELRAAVAKTGR
jgi:hypothetical protein